MTPAQYRDLENDIERIRPLSAIVLALVMVAPSVLEYLHNLVDFGSLLGRVVLALLVSGALVWLVTSVILYYARAQLTAGEDPMGMAGAAGGEDGEKSKGKKEKSKGKKDTVAASADGDG